MDSQVILMIGIILLYFVVFYFIKIRPDGKKKKAKQEMKRNLAPGDDVTMIDGIVASVCAVKDGTIVVETGADRVRLEYAKWAILEKGISVQKDKSEADE